MGKATSVEWTITPVAGATSMDAVLTGPDSPATVVDYPGLDPATTSLTTPLPTTANGAWRLAVTAIW